jgi:hypothetical protein
MSTIGYVTGRVVWDQGIPVPKGTTVTLRGPTIGEALDANGEFLLKLPANQDVNNYQLAFQSPVLGLVPAVGNFVWVMLLRAPYAVDLGNIYPWPPAAVTGRLKPPPDAVLQPGSFGGFTVYASGTSAVCLANADGTYALGRVAAGRRDIVVRNALGTTQSISALLQPGQLNVVNVNLPGPFSPPGVGLPLGGP